MSISEVKNKKEFFEWLVKQYFPACIQNKITVEPCQLSVVFYPKENMDRKELMQFAVYAAEHGFIITSEGEGFYMPLSKLSLAIRRYKMEGV
jgi:hypothetical protein